MGHQSRWGWQAVADELRAGILSPPLPPLPRPFNSSLIPLPHLQAADDAGALVVHTITILKKRRKEEQMGRLHQEACITKLHGEDSDAVQMQKGLRERGSRGKRA